MFIIPQDTTRLRECLDAVLSCYSVRPDIDGLLAAVPRAAGPLRVDDIPLILERLDFAVEKRSVTLPELTEAQLPAFITRSDGQCCAWLPARAESQKIFPQGTVLQDDEQPVAMFVYPRKSATLLDISHMLYGHSLDWFWAPIKKFSAQYGEVLLCSVFINLFVLAFPLFSMNVYDRVVVNFTESTLLVLTSGVTLVLLFDLMFKTLRSHLLESIAARVGSQYDSDLMERMLSVKMTDMTLSVGERANIFREMQAVRDFYASRLAPALVDLPFFFLFVGTVFFIAPTLALIPLIGAAIMFAVNFSVQMGINRATKNYFAGMQSKTTTLIQMLTGMRTIKMMNAIGPKLFEWNIQSMKSSSEFRRSQFFYSLINNVSILVTYLVSIFVLFFGAYEVSEGMLTVGGLVACTMLASRAIGPVVGLAGVVAQYKRCRDVLVTVDKIFKLPTEGLGHTEYASSSAIKGALKFEEVSFKYKQQLHPALNKISFEIGQGEHVGIIGRSGAGKSTLARMIVSLIEPESGGILLDQYAMTAYSPYELRRHIGYVPQDAYFFPGTIESNILLGCDHATREQIDDAIRISGLDQVMKSTGRGLDMEVGENGDFLSGGQKQSIALARALVRNPAILVMDEPTNGIDSMLEATIRTELEAYLKNRTFILITHRTSLLSLVDRLVLLDKGRLVANGPRDEILKKLGGGA